MSRLQGLSTAELLALKEKAVQYFTRNGVPKKMEEALNEMFYDSPSDVYGYLMNFFRRNCEPPGVESISYRRVISSLGEPSLEIELQCKFANEVKTYAAVSLPPIPKVGTQPEGDLSTEGTVIAFLSDHVSPFLNTNNDLLDIYKSGTFEEFIVLVIGLGLILNFIFFFCSDYYGTMEKKLEEEWAKQRLADQEKKAAEALAESGKKGKDKSPKKSGSPDTFEPIPKPKGMSIVSTLSKLLCSAVSTALEVPPFEAVELLKEQVSSQRSNFAPLVVIAQNGKLSSGKLKCFKELFITLSSILSLDDMLMNYIKIQENLRLKLFAKSGTGTVI